jgi:methionyl-tRNA formyltransferase
MEDIARGKSMRILLCLNRDFMSNIALNQLRDALAGQIIDIVLSKGIGKKSSPKAPSIEHWQQLESRLIENQLFPLLAKSSLTSTLNWFQSFDQLARVTVSKTIREFSNLNEGEGLAYVQQFDPDVIISIRFGQIFKSSVIDIPRFGVINLHSGVLPDYRGILATFWAMLNDETHVGCSLHYVTDNTIDTGDIIGITKIPADTKRSLLRNIAALYEPGAVLIADALSKLSSNQPLSRHPQDNSKGRYFSFPSQREVKEFVAKGYQLYSMEDYSALMQRYGIDKNALPTDAVRIE